MFIYIYVFFFSNLNMKVLHSDITKSGYCITFITTDWYGLIHYIYKCWQLSALINLEWTLLMRTKNLIVELIRKILNDIQTNLQIF